MKTLPPEWREEAHNHKEVHSLTSLGKLKFTRFTRYLPGYRSIKQLIGKQEGTELPARLPENFLEETSTI